MIRKKLNYHFMCETKSSQDSREIPCQERGRM